jgi:hypothetical protein
MRDQQLWRRSQEIEAAPDETEHLLDLAAFADNRLDDEDEAARIAALLARDLDAAADVAAARVLDVTMVAADEAIVARAAALVGESRPAVELRVAALPEAELINFPRRRMAPPWHSAATWSGLAAAIAIAGWLGFDLGSGVSIGSRIGHDDQTASELLAPAPLMLRDFAENS